MATATPIDSTQGTIKEATFSGISKSTAGHGTTYIKTYKRTYVHYLNNNSTTPPSTPTGTYTYAAYQTPNYPRCNCYSEGEYMIPYHNLGISTTPGAWMTDFNNISRVKVLSLGFNVKNITVLQESLVNRGATTTVENVFEGKPYAMMWIDHGHMMDQNLGYVNQTTLAPLETAENAHVQWAMAGASDGNTAPASVRAWNSLPSQPTGLDSNLNSTNNYCLSPWPSTQALGELPHVGFYVQESSNTGAIVTSDPQQRPMDVYSTCYRFGLTDIFDTQIVSEGDKPSHHWVNPKPDWRSVSIPNHGWTSNTTHTQVGAAGPLHQSTSFPMTRLAALAYSYRRFLLDDQTAAGMNMYVKDHDYFNAITGSGALDTGVWESFKPPNVYFKVAPILGPVGTTNITMQVMIEYTMTLEMEIAHTGTMSVMAFSLPANWTQANAYNTFGVVNVGVQGDPRGYTGANNTFWSSDGSGFAYNGQANQKRKQKKSIEHGVIGDNVKQDGSKRVRDDNELLEEHLAASE